MGKWRYGVIVDAGSSGTRVHVYRWLNSARALSDADTIARHSLPKLETKSRWTKKVTPGVSTFGERPAEVGPHHLQELLDHALSIVPDNQVSDTPIFLMATAGVRLLPKLQQSALLSEICSYARKHSRFSLPDCELHIQVIPGETEGLYGWIAANYLLGGFDSPEQHAHGKGHHTYGFLDMGGASAQIAFAPNTTEAEKHSNDLKLLRLRTLNGRPSEYKVFTATWLGFGVNQARQRYLEALIDASYTQDTDELLDPCLPIGLRTKVKGTEIKSATEEGANPFLIGTGLFDECLRQTYPLLDKDAPCADQPCLLHGQHVPAIDFEVNHFVGVSEYWHTMHELSKVSDVDIPYDFTSYHGLVKEFCSQKWDDIKSGVAEGKWGKNVDDQTAEELCFKTSWLLNVLHDGIGIPKGELATITSGLGYNVTKEVSPHAKEKGFLDPFQAVHKINDVEVSWTLGKMVLYAAGQIPPSTEDPLPVGFGSNVAGIPADFQKAGSNSDYVPLGEDDDRSETAESLAGTAHSRSKPAFLFMIILIFIIYVFRKRERRMRFYRGLQSAWRRNRRPGSPRRGGRSFFGGSKFLGGRSTGNYERVLEEGEAAHEFELGEVDSDDNEHSDSSDGSRAGRSSGLATPKLNVVNFEKSNFFDHTLGHGQGVGLGLHNSGNGLANPMDRSGLVVRTESRERLGPSLQMLGAGRRSRATSPTRLKSPLMAPLEEV